MCSKAPSLFLVVSWGPTGRGVTSRAQKNGAAWRCVARVQISTLRHYAPCHIARRAGAMLLPHDRGSNPRDSTQPQGGACTNSPSGTCAITPTQRQGDATRGDQKSVQVVRVGWGGYAWTLEEESGHYLGISVCLPIRFLVVISSECVHRITVQNNESFLVQTFRIR